LAQTESAERVWPSSELPARTSLGHDGAVQLGGSVDARFTAVRDVFADVLDGQSGTGAAFAVWCDGISVVDIWGGYSDVGRRAPWRRESIVQPYSVSKPFAAVCALKLVEKGDLDLDAPVQRYWPEFSAPATVRQLLSHQAGVVALDTPVPTEAFYDWRRLCRLLAAQEPAWEPGTAHGESAMFYGHLVGELVRRVDGRSLGLFLRREICEVHGIDFSFGLDAAEQARAVDVTGLDSSFRAANASGRPPLYRRAAENPAGAQEAAVVNSAAWRAAEIPAINGHGTARGIAQFYDALSNGRVLSAEVVAEATRPQCSGPDLVFGGDNTWGLGFGIDDDGFGMGGLGGSYGGRSTGGGYSLAFVTGTAGTHERGTRLENSFRSCLGMAPIA
jgi:CubicO group peptidase (beta-lactamase class C family)